MGRSTAILAPASEMSRTVPNTACLSPAAKIRTGKERGVRMNLRRSVIRALRLVMWQEAE